MEYRVEYRNVKHARIDIRRGEITVILRKGMKAEDFLQEHWNWVEKHYRQYMKTRERTLSELDKNEVFILGERHEIVRDCKLGPSIREGRITVCLERPRETKEMLKELLRNEIVKRVERYSALLGERAEKIFIREQVTKWGTCSSRRNLGFNLRLIFTEPEFLDYIVAHEVTHLRHMNHGREFKRELRALHGKEPPTKEHMMRHWFRSTFMMENLTGKNRE